MGVQGATSHAWGFAKTARHDLHYTTSDLSHSSKF